MSSLTAKRLLWSGAVLLLCIGGCLLLYALKLSFTESLYSQRGSFAHFVTITEPVIRTFPLFDATSEPQYHSGCGDGPKLPDQAVSYRSRLPTSELLALAQRHVKSCGYSPGSAHDLPGLAFVRDSRTLYLNVTTADDGTTLLAADVIFDIHQ